MRLSFVSAAFFGLWLTVASGERTLRGSLHRRELKDHHDAQEPNLPQPDLQEQKRRRLSGSGKGGCTGANRNRAGCRGSGGGNGNDNNNNNDIEDSYDSEDERLYGTNLGPLNSVGNGVGNEVDFYQTMMDHEKRKNQRHRDSLDDMLNLDSSDPLYENPELASVLRKNKRKPEYNGDLYDLTNEQATWVNPALRDHRFGKDKNNKYFNKLPKKNKETTLQRLNRMKRASSARTVRNPTKQVRFAEPPAPKNNGGGGQKNHGGGHNHNGGGSVQVQKQRRKKNKNKKKHKSEKKRKSEMETPEQRKVRRNKELDDLLDKDVKFEDANGKPLKDEKEIQRKKVKRQKIILAEKWVEQVKFRDENGNDIDTRDPILKFLLVDREQRNKYQKFKSKDVNALRNTVKANEGQLVEKTITAKDLAKLKTQAAGVMSEMLKNRKKAIKRAKASEPLRKKLLEAIDDVDLTGITDPNLIKEEKERHAREVLTDAMMKAKITFVDESGRQISLKPNVRKELMYWERKSIRKRLRKSMSQGVSLDTLIEQSVSDSLDGRASLMRRDSLDFLTWQANHGHKRMGYSVTGARKKREEERKAAEKQKVHNQAFPNGGPSLADVQNAQRNRHVPTRTQSVSNVNTVTPPKRYTGRFSKIRNSVADLYHSYKSYRSKDERKMDAVKVGDGIETGYSIGDTIAELASAVGGAP